MATSKKKISKDLSIFRGSLTNGEIASIYLLPDAGTDPEDRQACILHAILGDSLIRTAVTKELGVLAHGSPKEDDGENPSVEDTSKKLRGLTAGFITSRISATVSNDHLAKNSGDILLGVDGVNVSEKDLKGLSRHQKATAVEAAVAMVHAQFGEVPIRALARELIRRSEPVRNWKGMFLERNGSVEIEKIGEKIFEATAILEGKWVHKSRQWPTRTEAEQDACEECLKLAGMVAPSDSPPRELLNEQSNWTGILYELGGDVTASPGEGKGSYCATASLSFGTPRVTKTATSEQPHGNKNDARQEASRVLLERNDLWQHASRVAFKQKRSREAMEDFSRTAAAQVDASWLKVGMKNLLFQQLGLNENSTIILKNADARWFVEKAHRRDGCFRALKLAPSIIPDIVESVYIWGATLHGPTVDGDSTNAGCKDGASTDVTTTPGSADGDSTLVKKGGPCVAVALVTLKPHKSQPDEAQLDQARWFVGQTQPSMNQAKRSVASVAILELGLIDRARELVDTLEDSH